ncbi:HNH endonuclease signature motif containing protein [Agromyces neolithicus]|uniref:HNH nuclease domain-containing protein n=1 Tax=Agromyces neolithicus TaxID=269420 RepID=A0ABP4YG84_9MICO
MEDSFDADVDWDASFDALVASIEAGDGDLTVAGWFGGESDEWPTSHLSQPPIESQPPRGSLPARERLASLLFDAEAAQFTANRAMADQLEAIDLAVDLARRMPRLYLQPSALGGSGTEELAVRAVVADVAARLRLSEATVRTQAHLAASLRQHLPQLWQRCVSGVVPYADMRSAVDQLMGLRDDPEVRAEFDAGVARIAGTMTPARFRAAARALRARLERESLTARHARALAERRVVFEPVDDGMTWVSMFVDSVDAARIKARLNSTARHVSRHQGEQRTRDQVRADLAVAWLAGDGTPTAAKVDVIVTVPLLTVTGADDAPAHLDGHGPIDPATARQLFADSPSFLRVAVDPITSAPLDLDRTRYRPTKAQRRWLALRFGTCARAGCGRLAVDSDIDHLLDWFLGGRTNEGNLVPLCHHHHRLKHVTKFRVKRTDPGTVQWTSPTGHTAGNDPPPF